MIFRTLVSVMFFCFILFAPGCAHIESLKEVAERMETANTAILDPNRQIDGMLECLGRQLSAFRPVGAKPLIIAIYPYLNKTFSVTYIQQDTPVDATSVIKALINEIGPQITYSNLLEAHDPIQAQVLFTLMPEVKKPDLYLQGALLIVERATQAESSSVDFGISISSIGSLRYSQKALQHRGPGVGSQRHRRAGIELWTLGTDPGLV
ncbi:MAG: hypothetical protein ACRERU_18855 [Methylococcales bacterium]